MDVFFVKNPKAIWQAFGLREKHTFVFTIGLMVYLQNFADFKSGIVPACLMVLIGSWQG